MNQWVVNVMSFWILKIRSRQCCSTDGTTRILVSKSFIVILSSYIKGCRQRKLMFKRSKIIFQLHKNNIERLNLSFLTIDINILFSNPRVTVNVDVSCWFSQSRTAIRKIMCHYTDNDTKYLISNPAQQRFMLEREGCKAITPPNM